eukprot:COSAG01_NODE_1804_length_9192_cov_31.006049_1_plen_101_part_10
MQAPNHSESELPSPLTLTNSAVLIQARAVCVVMMTSGTLPNFCAAYCACGKLAAARSGEHGAARKQQRRRQQQALALCARRRPQPALDLVGGAAFLQGAPV